MRADSDPDYAHGGTPSHHVEDNVDDRHDRVPTPGSNWTSGLVYNDWGGTASRRTSPMATSSSGLPVQATRSASAKEFVQANAGARWRLDCGGALVSTLDAVDRRIIDYVDSGHAPARSITSETDSRAGNGPTGWPNIANVGGSTCAPSARDNSACACADSDADGLPDYWESAWCGSPTGCDPGATSVAAPWTDLEAYLSGMKPARLAPSAP